MFKALTAIRSAASAARRRHRAPLARWLATWMALLAAPAASPAQTATPGEYEVKAAFLYNFARFGEWPTSAFTDGSKLRLCIIGSDPFGPALGVIAGKPVGMRSVEIVRLDGADDPRHCQIAFIAGGNLAAATQIARRLERLPILTVAEMPDFARAGGAIEFYLVDNRVRFAINPDAAQRAGVTLSSQLLRLALIVQERR